MKWGCVGVVERIPCGIFLYSMSLDYIIIFCIKKCRESTLEKLWGKGKTFCWKIGNELTGAMVGVPVAMLIPAIGLEIAPRAWIGAGPGITPTPWMRPLEAAVVMACCWWWEAEGAEIDMIPDMGGIDLCAF